MKFAVVVLLISSLLMSCNRPAGDLPTVEQRLTAVGQWNIKEILIDEAPVFKEGKTIPHISGITFDRYMDWVRFKADGTFEGHFKGDSATKLMQWKTDVASNSVQLADSVTKTGGWNIYPRNVYADAFEMEARSTVYDPPRMTKITLKFVK
jgi:hypothetical protein